MSGRELPEGWRRGERWPWEQYERDVAEVRELALTKQWDVTGPRGLRVGRIVLDDERGTRHPSAVIEMALDEGPPRALVWSLHRHDPKRSSVRTGRWKVLPKDAAGRTPPSGTADAVGGRTRRPPGGP